jgi:hypothetical protein
MKSAGVVPFIYRPAMSPLEVDTKSESQRLSMLLATKPE